MTNTVMDMTATDLASIMSVGVDLSGLTDTTIMHGDTQLRLLQDAYLDDDCYLASAVDVSGNLYMVRWDITHPDPNNCCDESEMCDWDNYTVTQL